MDEQKTRIVIAQTYQDVLCSLEDDLRSAKNLEVHYVTTPTEAFKLAIDPKTRILVTGQCFYGSDHKDRPNISTLLRTLHPALGRELVDDSFRRFGNMQDGNCLAGAIREANSEILTLRYSATPESRQYFCGDVAKFSGDLAGLLKSKEFNLALQKKDSSLLPARAAVSWYADNFPTSWKREI